ncbi:cytochrome c [Paraglaciecola aquimarina]|uniref:Cytochrome c n=1 Tax=Paraglaciecola aquimarina TaxID=1235557 RepID=A0ABU3SYX9_9ALTE|nr:cytochrome c [Paraglaciecola aquimarina]MDU0355225.1 cytochrome c [Paraglaciecola aquimarina]
MNRFTLLPLVLALGSGHTLANELDEQLTLLSQKSTAVQAGEDLFMQVCAACHAKDLSGATGFNLKDGEWIHGEQPSQILANIKQGFNKKGMPAFGAMFSDKQLQDVVAFIMSKREGLADLTYRLYQMTDENDVTVSEDKLIKSGALTKNLMDFELPEVKYYAIQFEGILYAPKEPSKLHIETWKLNPTSLFIDGKEVTKANPNASTWPLKPGKQKIKFQYIVGSDTKHSWKKNLALFVTTEDLGVKLFGLSTRSHKIMMDTKVLVTAQNKPVIQRKKIHDLPTYSVSVGFPEKINYAFNTRSCNVVGVWTGDLLNVGPNVESRGKDGSIVLGEWLIGKNDSLAMQNASQCQYKKMTNKGIPAFYFKQGAVDYKLTTSNMSATGLTLNYEMLSNKNTLVSFDLPTNDKVKIVSPDGKIQGNKLTINANSSAFSIQLSAK